MRITTIKGVTIIAIAAFISWVLALYADISNAGLGGLFNLFWPPILGLISLSIYVFICWLSRNNWMRLCFLFILTAYLLYVGFALYFQMESLPFIYL